MLWLQAHLEGDPRHRHAVGISRLRLEHDADAVELPVSLDESAEDLPRRYLHPCDRRGAEDVEVLDDDVEPWAQALIPHPHDELLVEAHLLRANILHDIGDQRWVLAAFYLHIVGPLRGAHREVPDHHPSKHHTFGQYAHFPPELLVEVGAMEAGEATAAVLRDVSCPLAVAATAAPPKGKVKRICPIRMQELVARKRVNNSPSVHCEHDERDDHQDGG
mmetsp:Transcript_54198/g.129115  ORF Transcript_54198/g.129115 Transcript_54198/m.129115 type:complete len:219 (-) Transcript_54198:294-950(-)